MTAFEFMGPLLQSTWGFFTLPLLHDPFTITLGGFLLGCLVISALFGLIRSLVLGGDHD